MKRTPIRRLQALTTDMQQQAADQMDAFMSDGMQIIDETEDAVGA